MKMPLEDVYQEVILDHNRRPRHYEKMENADVTTHGINPLCGDDYYLYLKTDGQKVIEASFEGTGCAISKASASMMASRIQGQSLDHVDALAKSEGNREKAESSVEELKSALDIVAQHNLTQNSKLGVLTERLVLRLPGE